MADPMTLAMVGAAAGAVTNKKDPLKGALLGATLGGVGGSLAPGLLGTGATQAASGAAGAAGLQSGFGAQLAGQGLLSTAPAMSGGASPVASALASQGMTSAPALMSTPAAAPSMLSRLNNPAVLAAGSQLASSMTPRPAQSYPLPMRQVTAVENVIDQVPIVRGPGGPMPRLQDDEIIRALLWPRELAYPVSMGGKP